MTKTYEKPVVTVDPGLAEGIYAASGASTGNLNVSYYGVWDRWGSNGGKGLAMADWSPFFTMGVSRSFLNVSYP